MDQRRTKLVGEQLDLDAARADLRAFVESASFKQINEDEQFLMVRQLFVMGRYSAILGERIALLSKETAPCSTENSTTG